MGVSLISIALFTDLIILRSSITTREAEVKEDWKTQSVEQQDKIRGGSLSAWGFGAGDLIKTGERIVKVSSLLIEFQLSYCIPVWSL